MAGKVLKSLSFVLATSLLLSGCMPSSNEASKQSGKQVEITIGGWPQENKKEDVEIYNKLVEVMKARYPYITVKPDMWTYDVKSFLPKAASGQLPTVYSTYFTEPDKIISSGYAADITEPMKRYQYDKAINKKFLDLVTKNNKIYGIPYSSYVIGLMYNMNLMKQAGELDANGVPNAPKTYQELAEMAQRIKQKTGKPGLFLSSTKNEGGWQFMNIAWSFGAEFEKKVNGKWVAAFNSPEGVAALQYVKDLKWKYDVLPDNVLVDDDQFTKLFSTDQVAIGIKDPSKAKKAIANYKMSKDNIAMSKLPSGPAGIHSLTGGNIFVFAPNASPEQIDAGFKWLAIRGQTPNVTDDMKDSLERSYKSQKEQGSIVGVTGMNTWINPERLKAEEEIRNKYNNVNMALFNDYLAFGNVQIHPEEPVLTQELYNLMDVAIQTVLTNKNANPKELLDKAADEFTRIYLDRINQ